MSENALGRILYAHLSVKWYRDPSYYENKPWRATLKGAGGGVLMVQAIHMFDLLQWFLGDVDKVYGQIETLFHKIEVEDRAFGWISFKSGITADFHASTLHYPEEPACIEIIGEKGSAILQEKRGYLSLNVNLLNGQQFRILPSQSFGDIDNQDASSPALLSSEGHKAGLKSYFEGLRKGRSPDVDGREALKSLSIIESIYISSQMGEATKVKK
jgi:predicted dehydrogenase